MHDTMPKQNCSQYCCDGSNPDDLMITGMAGKFPCSDNIDELQAALYSNRDLWLPSGRRWKLGSCDKTRNYYHMNDVSKFDAKFFGMSYAEAQLTDPSHRIFLELCYEAIADAGYDPHDLRGRKIGVYCAITQYDTRDLMWRQTNINDFDMRKFEAGLHAGYVSSFFDFKGPSYVIDTACSSSLIAFTNAYNDLNSGHIEAAIVGGLELTLNRDVHYGYVKTKLTIPDGPSYAFDARAVGLVRGESTVAMFVQKASEARRVYAKIMNSFQNTAGYVLNGMYVPSKDAQVKLFRETLRKSGVNPLDIDFMEAHGTGTKIGDPIEVSSMDEVYCPGRKTPLLIGTIKGNIGHTEAVAGLASILKSVLAFETGLICPNIRYKTPNPNIPALIDGRVVVVDKNTPLTSDFIALNCFGFGGTNAHAILKKNVVERKPNDGSIFPELVLYAATTYEGVEFMLKRVTQSAISSDFLYLLRNLAYVSPLSKPYRGYALISQTPSVDIELCLSGTKEVWYVVTGLGCHWPGMGSKLMKIDAFSESIERSSKVVKSLGIDLLGLIKTDAKKLSHKPDFTSTLVSTCAIQVALINVLKHLGISPNGIIGHSIGELACAYADGCLTAEEVVLSAYYVGKAVESSKVVAGAMALIEMTPEQTKTFSVKDVHIVSQGPEGYVTLSGQEKPMKQLIDKLMKENKFAIMIDTCGYALHSPYMDSTTSAIKKFLGKVIANSRPRSSLWISTSYLPDHRNKGKKSILDAESIANNLRADIHFTEAMKRIPPNSVIIEISPDTLLQFKLSCGQTKGLSHISLMKQGEDLNFMLEGIGKLYCMGLNPKIEVLYPPPQYPVSRGTPSISSLIKWDHSFSFFVPKYIAEKVNDLIPIRTGGVSEYLLDHCLDGKCFFPATGYVWLAWQAFANLMLEDLAQFPIHIENFKIHRAVLLSVKEDKYFEVFISRADGTFEINESQSMVASGKISSPKHMKFRVCDPLYEPMDDKYVLMGEELYSELRIRGYEYGPHFQALKEIAIDGSQSRIKWNGKWPSYLDAHLFMFGIMYDKGFSLPVGCRSIKIDPVQFFSFIKSEESNSKGVPVRFERNIQCCSSPGIEIRSLDHEVTQHRLSSTGNVISEECRFLPYKLECAIPRNAKDTAVEYIDVCNAIANKVAEKIQATTDKQFPKCKTTNLQSKILDQYLNPEEPNKNHILLNLLNKPENFESSENKKKCFENYLNTAGSDVLYQTLFNGYNLRIIFETVSENVHGKIKVTELYNGSPPTLPLINTILKQFYNCKLTSMLFHPEPEILDADVLRNAHVDVKILDSKDNIQASEQDVVISSFLFGNQDDLKSHINLLIKLIHDRGFILFYHRSAVSSAELLLGSLCDSSVQTVPTPDFVDVLHKSNLTIISENSDSLGNTLYLLRYDLNKIDYSCDMIINITDDCYKWVEELKQAIVSVNEHENGRIWLVADDNPNNGIIGMVKCLKQEPGGEKIRCVQVFKDNNSRIPPFDLNNAFYSEVAKRDVLMNVYQDGKWGSFKHAEISTEREPKLVKHSCIQCMVYGDLSSFQWLESNIPYKWDLKNEELACICYSGINFKDVMIASGKLSIGAAVDEKGDIPFCPLGFEFSGITRKGRRIMGMAPSQCLANSIVLSRAAVMDVPDHWSLEEAATVPIVYSTAYFTLITRGKLKHGESILIHSGTGGVGIAAVRIAMSLNCQIFVTVGTNEKRQYLKKLFPEIDDDCIGCSRDVSFVNMVLNKTKGKGVDMVLNSLAGDKLQAGTQCLAEGGRFMEIGKYDLSIDTPIGMSMFAKGATFAGVMLDDMFNGTGCISMSGVSEMVMDGIRKGVVQPLERTVFAHNEVENAFRYMATGKHVGKVILKIQDEPPKGTVPKPLEQKARPSLYFHERKTYIVIGGLGGFGVELTKWILQNGAENVVITSRYGVRTPYHELCLLRWKYFGKNVKVLTFDAGKREEAKRLLEEASKMGPVGGIFNSAVILHDAFMENQTLENFEEVCGPKANASKNLDELSRTMCPELDHFVCFSSISCGKGNAGQTNYGYANSVMERICEKRRREGLHGLAIQWGIIGDVGVVHRNLGDDAMISGVVAQKILSCLSTLEQFLLLDHAVLASYVTIDASKGKKRKQDDHLTQIAKVFGFPSAAEMKTNRTFRELGMDSMIGVEIQHLLETTYDISLSIKELQEITINNLTDIIESKSKDEEIVVPTTERDKDLIQNFHSPPVSTSEFAIISLNKKQVGTPIIFVHHCEMEIKKAESLIYLLSSPVYGIVATTETSMESIEAMAASYLKELSKKVAECHLVGLTTCAALAFEMHLQSQSHTNGPLIIKSLTILDGASHLTNALTGAWKSTPTGETDISDLCNYLKMFTDSNLDQVKASLSMKESYDSKLHYVANMCNSAVRDYTISVADLIQIYRKTMVMCREYKPSNQLDGNILIMESTASLLANDVAPVKSALSKVCLGQISVHRVPGSENFLREPNSSKSIAALMNESFQDGQTE